MDSTAVFLSFCFESNQFEKFIINEVIAPDILWNYERVSLVCFSPWALPYF